MTTMIISCWSVNPLNTGHLCIAELSMLFQKISHLCITNYSNIFYSGNNICYSIRTIWLRRIIFDSDQNKYSFVHWSGITPRTPVFYAGIHPRPCLGLLIFTWVIKSNIHPKISYLIHVFSCVSAAVEMSPPEVV